jgi:hypothetical protein
MNPSRRSFLLGLATSLAATPALAQFAAPAGFPAQFSSVVVDVRPLQARQLGAYAEFVRQALTAELQRAFADRLGGPGPRLVVVVSGISLSPYAGGTSLGRGRFGGGGGDNDYLEGEALLVGARGEVLARRPQLSVTPSSSGGAWYDPLSEQKRTAVLAQHYAQWLRRQI